MLASFAPRPSVMTRGCSRSSSVSGMRPCARASTRSFCARSPSAYSTRPSRRTCSVLTSSPRRAPPQAPRAARAGPPEGGGLALDQGRPPAAAGAIDRFFHRGIHGERVVAVHLHAGEAVGLRLDRDRFARRLLAGRDADGPVVVLTDEHDRG